jgi:serine O-acetyltransferase
MASRRNALAGEASRRAALSPGSGARLLQQCAHGRRRGQHSRLRRFAITPERLWLLSIALQTRGHRRLARYVRNINSALYHNSLPPGATVSPDIKFGHHSLGTVIHTNVVIGRRVKIWHNVTIAMRAGAKSPYRIIVEDDVNIGANAVVISPYRRDLRIGRGARIGAGAVVSRDVPPGCTVVSAPARFIEPDGEAAEPRPGAGAETDRPTAMEPGVNRSGGPSGGAPVVQPVREAEQSES